MLDASRCPLAESIRINHAEQKRLPSLLLLYLCIAFHCNPEMTGSSAMTGSSLRVSKLAKRGRSPSLAGIRQRSQTHQLNPLSRNDSSGSGSGACVLHLTIRRPIGARTSVLGCEAEAPECFPEELCCHQDDVCIPYPCVIGITG